MTSVDHPDALPGGYRVQEFELLSVLGVGGFGITYLAKDTFHNHIIAIKEYFPKDFAVRKEDHSVHPRSSPESENYTWGLERFQDEARILAQLSHPGIIRVYKYFEAHGSGYIVMEYIRGETLSERLRRESTLDEPQLMAILNPLVEGLEQVHATGYLHRDITPKNILLRKDGSPVLIDFGSARRQVLGMRSHSVTAVATPGYAPLEQYSTRGKQQGPWTDIYGLSAVAYRCITGIVPKDATERAQGETLTSASELAEGQYATGLLTAVDRGLAVKIEERPKDLKAWRSLWMQKEKQQRYRLAAEQGDADAQFRLGVMYCDGEGVPKDYAEAVKWYRRAAKRGNARAQYSLGRMYRSGRGVPQSDAEAVKWLRMAAEQGDARAQSDLGFMYSKVRNIQDFAEGRKWLRMAAEQGDVEAQKTLGWMSALGCVGQDCVKAHKWFNLAILEISSDPSKLSEDSSKLFSVKSIKEWLDRLEKKMTQEEITTARRLAREWQPKTWDQLKAERARSSTATKAKKQEVKQSEIKSAGKKKTSHDVDMYTLYVRGMLLLMVLLLIISFFMHLLESD